MFSKNLSEREKGMEIPHTGKYYNIAVKPKRKVITNRLVLNQFSMRTR